MQRLLNYNNPIVFLAFIIIKCLLITPPVLVECADLLYPDEDLNCFTPDNNRGSCIQFRSCEYLMQLANKHKNVPRSNQISTLETYLRKSVCGYQGKDVLFCCPAKKVGHIPTASNGNQYVAQPSKPASGVSRRQFKILTSDESQCGLSNGTHRRSGRFSFPAQLKAWSWMSLLGYRSTPGASPKFQCGGSLVTQQHVLTSAHCIKDTLMIVRLGEYNVDSVDDGASPIDVGIMWKIAHEKFNPKSFLYDIGLIKLASWVDITDGIRPICLPKFEPLRSMNLTRFNPYIAGWGAVLSKEQPLSVLKDNQLPINSIEKCQAQHQLSYPGQAFEEHLLLCTGYDKGPKDSCEDVDTGGPLMFPTRDSSNKQFYWNLIGIMPLGFECKSPNIYTKVTHFIPWIESHLND